MVFYEIAIDYLKILKHRDKDGEDNYNTKTVAEKHAACPVQIRYRKSCYPQNDTRYPQHFPLRLTELSTDEILCSIYCQDITAHLSARRAAEGTPRVTHP